MKSTEDSYTNGQKITEQKGVTLTYYFEDGTIKAQGKSVNGIMQDKWIFNKKEGYLWQVGHFNDEGKKHGSWVRYNSDGSVQNQAYFEQGQQIKKQILFASCLEYATHEKWKDYKGQQGTKIKRLLGKSFYCDYA